ncbi:MAG: hypothetical protein E2P02_23705 [Acidobacteria bacterium]|nr:MAG: hypothetical protein E2P02_23705 [Acidobacteriota bacterium]
MTIKDLIRQYSTGKRAPTEDFAAAQAIADTFAEQLAAINSNTRLTRLGKSEAATELAHETLAAVDGWHDPLKKRMSEAGKFFENQLHAAVTPKRSDDPADRMDAALLRAELRRAVAGMNAQEIEVLYRTADSEDIRTALEELPRIEKKVGPSSCARTYPRPCARRCCLRRVGARCPRWLTRWTK